MRDGRWLRGTSGTVTCAAALAIAACSGGSVAKPALEQGGLPSGNGPSVNDAGIPTFGGDDDGPLPTGPSFDGGVSSGPVQSPTFGPTTTQANAPPPISGGTLALSSDGSLAFAADPDRDAVYVVNLASATSKTVALQPGDEPGRVALDAAGRVHVVLRGGGAIATIDPTAATVLSRTAVCSRPRGIAYSKTADSMFVTCASGELITLPAAGGAATRTVVLEPDLRDVVMVGTTAVVSAFRSADLMQVAADGTVATHFAAPVLQGEAPGVAWKMIPTANGVAVSMQFATPSAVAPVQGGYGSGGCLGSVTNPAISTWSVDGTWQGVTPITGALPVDIALSSDQTRFAAVVPGEWRMPGSFQLVVTPAAAMSQVRTTMTHRPIVTQDDPSPPIPIPTPPPPMDAGGVGCPGAPIAVDGQATAVAFLPTGDIVVQTREPARLQIIDGSTLIEKPTSILLSSISRDDTGHEVFHSDVGGGISCSSCHPEGADDGRVWQFADVGARRTPSTLGTIAGTAPYHWDGSQTDLPMLYHGSLQRMNGADLALDQVAAFSSWLSALPGPKPVSTDSAAVARGLALFQNEGACASCHSGPKLTNNATVDVGTGAPMQVPPLVGVSWRAPFLHDGCAATLTDAIDACGHGTTHGTASSFTSAQIADLTAYLESL